MPPYSVKNPEIQDTMDFYFAEGTLALQRKNYVRAYKFFEFLRYQFQKYKKFAINSTKLISLDSEPNLLKKDIENSDCHSSNRQCFLNFLAQKN